MNKLLELKFGSHLYGTDTPNSDLDLKSIYIPSAREIVLGNYKKTICTVRPKGIGERNNKEDVDVEIFSLDRYLQLLAQGQTVALDFLFGYKQGEISNKSRIMDYIYENKDKLISKDLTSFIGYAKQQAAKYGLKGFRVAALRATLEWLETQPIHYLLSEIPTITFVGELQNEHVTFVTKPNPHGKFETFLKVCDKFYSFNCSVKVTKEQIQRRFHQYGSRAMKAEVNEGVDWKALSHAVRVNNQGIELLKTGYMTFPRPDRELLLEIKTGKIEYNKVADIIVQGLEDLKEDQVNSALREKPDQEWIDNFIYKIYSGIVKGVNYNI